MGIFNLGGVIGAFKPPKLERIYKSPELQDEVVKSTRGMDDFRTQSGGYLSNYESANRNAINEATRLNRQTEGEVNDMIRGLGGASFLGDRERVREGDLAALTGLLGQLGGGMSRSNKIAASRLGYAGRPSGTYMDRQRASFLGEFGSPIASQIFGGLNSAARGAADERFQNVNQRMGLTQFRNQLPSNLAEMELNPLEALTRARRSEIGLLGGLTDVNNANFAGFKEKPNQWAAAAGAIDQSLNSALDTAMSLYSGGLMGGGGGGMMGGLLGGMGGGMGGGGGYATAVRGLGMGGYLPSNFGGLSTADQQAYAMGLLRNPYIGYNAINNPWE